VVQSNPSSTFARHLRMGNLDFRVSFFGDCPPVPPKRLLNIVAEMPKKFHADLHRNASEPANGFPTGEGHLPKVLYETYVLRELNYLQRGLYLIHRGGQRHAIPFRSTSIACSSVRRHMSMTIWRYLGTR